MNTESSFRAEIETLKQYFFSELKVRSERDFYEKQALRDRIESLEEKQSRLLKVVEDLQTQLLEVRLFAIEKEEGSSNLESLEDKLNALSHVRKHSENVVPPINSELDAHSGFSSSKTGKNSHKKSKSQQNDENKYHRNKSPQ